MTGTRRTSGSKGKNLALFLAAATAITLTAAILPGGPFVEWWRIHRLSRRLAHGTLAEKVEATEQLGRTGSSRAVIPLLRFIADQPSHLDVQRIEKSRRQVSPGNLQVEHDLGAQPIYTLSIEPVPDGADLEALIQSASIPLSGCLTPPEVLYQPPLVQHPLPPVPDGATGRVGRHRSLLRGGGGGPRLAGAFLVTGGEGLQQRAALAIKAILHWYDRATEYSGARQALARIGADSIPILKQAAKESDHPGVRALAALELLRRGIVRTAKEAFPTR